MTRSPWLRVCGMQLDALFTLAFAPAPRLQTINLAAYRNSQVYSTKDTPLPIKGCDILSVYGFRFSFTPLAGVLFAFPSRYFSAIGSCLVFSLGSWSTRIPTGFHVPRRTQVPHQQVLLISRTWLSHSLTGLPRPFRYNQVFSQLAGSSPCGPTTPLEAVWAPPRSLAATYGISIDFCSRVT